MPAVDIQSVSEIQRKSHLVESYDSTQITLVVFWSATSLHCLRLLPHLKRWWTLYHPSGLSIEMVILPEYKFEKDPAYVSEISTFLDLPWPSLSISNSPQNINLGPTILPRVQLLQGNGTVLYESVGEGHSKAIEDAICQALIHAGVVHLPPLTLSGEHQHTSGKQCFPTYPDIFLDAKRAHYKNTQSIESDIKLMIDPLDAATSGASLQGQWRIDSEGLFSTPQTKPDGYLSIVFAGFELLAVLAPATNQPCIVSLALNGRPLTASESGRDVISQTNTSTVLIDRPRLYQLVSSQNYLAPAELRLHLSKGHLAAYTITTSGCKRDVDW